MRHAAIVLPGNGYGPQGPVLLIPALALEEAGAVVTRIEYPARPAQWTEEAMGEMVAEVERRITDALGSDPWDKVTFVAKSLGAAILGRLDPAITGPASVAAIWLTPVFGDDAVFEGALAKRWPSLVAAGAADRYHDASRHDHVVAALGARSLVIDGADHGLEIPGDVVSTVDGYRRLAEETLAFTRARP